MHATASRVSHCQTSSMSVIRTAISSSENKLSVICTHLAQQVPVKKLQGTPELVCRTMSEQGSRISLDRGESMNYWRRQFEYWRGEVEYRSAAGRQRKSTCRLPACLSRQRCRVVLGVDDASAALPASSLLLRKPLLPADVTEAP